MNSFITKPKNESNFKHVNAGIIKRSLTPYKFGGYSDVDEGNRFSFSTHKNQNDFSQLTPISGKEN
jgi:hypothetical protein